MLQPPAPARRRAFTLTEVLISLAILVIGVTAVAALLPSAAVMQRDLIREVLDRQDLRSTEAVLQAKGVRARTLHNFLEGLQAPTTATRGIDDVMPALLARGGSSTTLNSYDDLGAIQREVFAFAEVDTFIPPGGRDATEVNQSFPDMRASSTFGGVDQYLLPAAVQNDTNGQPDRVESLLADWPLDTRSFPSFVPDISRRELFVVPLFQRASMSGSIYGDWTVFGFILRRDTRFGNPGGNGEPYDRTPSAITDGDGIVAANPFDNDDVVPKVFRIPVTNSGDDFRFGANVTNRATFTRGGRGLILEPGDVALGSNGVIYRVASIEDGDADIFRLVPDATQPSRSNNPDANTAPDALWVAIRPDANAPNPAREIRVFSEGVVQNRGA